MNIYEVLVIVTFVIGTIIMINQYINNEVIRVCDVLQLMNILPCYEITAFKNGRCINNRELIQHIKSPVKAYKIKEGILYIEIY